MIRTSVLAGLAGIAAGFALSAQAADPAVGQKLYEGTCIACHGPAGVSPAPIWPNLAGQKEAYVVTALRAFRDGTRTDETMSPQATNLSNTDIANIASYVSRLELTPGSGMPGDDGADAVAAGQKLYDSSCVACHGAGGISVAPLYANLAGQKEQYLVNATTAFRSGTRKDPIMSAMARHLSEQEITNLASYLSRLEP